MSMTKKEETGIIVGAVVFTFAVTEAIQDQLDGAISTIIDTFVNLIVAPFEMLAVVLQMIVYRGGQLMLSIITAPIDVITAIFGGVADFFSDLLTFSLTGGGSVLIAQTTAESVCFSGVGCIPHIGLVIIGIVVAGIGLGIVQSAPFGSDLVQGLGAIMIVIGAVLALYAMLPEYSLLIIGGGFAMVFIVGIMSYIGGVREAGSDQ